MALKADIDRQSSQPLRVALVGSIDENAPVASVLGAITEDATIDLSQIQSINSIGLMRWVGAFAPLTNRHRLAVERVPYCLSIQAGQISDLFAAARVLSCIAPYFCPSCNANREVTVTASEVKAGTPAAPDRTCEACKGTMDFDEMDGYFDFLVKSA